LSEQYAQQEARMDNVKAKLQNVLSGHLSEQLHKRMDNMIQKLIGNEIKKRVEHQVCSSSIHSTRFYDQTQMRTQANISRHCPANGTNPAKSEGASHAA
jgi:hypothetical protein